MHPTDHVDRVADAPRPALSDAGAVALAVSTAAGAWWAAPVPVAPTVALAAWALARGRRALLLVAVALLASGLAARSWDGLDPAAVVEAEVDERATLLTDPRPLGSGSRVEARLGERRVRLVAFGAAGRVLAQRLAGESVRVRGTLRPLDDRSARWWAHRHLSAEVSADRIARVQPATGAAALANGYRRTLEAGAAHLDPVHRALVTGIVVGDDRAQPPEVVHDFRASGLSHLMAVSGQNVAFVLVVAAPFLLRLGYRSRFAAVLVLLVLFGTLTRWEPSVVRACAMAATAAVATVVGRPATSVRILALAVTGLLLVDPLLVHSVGFQLSTGATAGIVVGAGPLAQRLPGPRWLALPVAVTLAAQVGVTPVLLPVFGSVPLVSLPANLLAAPAAGPVMVWGMTAGWLAGVAPGLAPLLHLPTAALVGWIATVARWAASLPLGDLDTADVMALGAVTAIGVTAVRGAGRWRTVVRPLVTAAVLMVLVVLSRPFAADLFEDEVARGVVVDRHADTTVVRIEGGTAGAALEGLRRVGVGRIDVLEVGGGARSADVARVVATRHPVDRITVIGPVEEAEGAGAAEPVTGRR